MEDKNQADLAGLVPKLSKTMQIIPPPLISQPQAHSRGGSNRPSPDRRVVAGEAQRLRLRASSAPNPFAP